MKTTSTHSEVQRQGVQSESTFSIKATAKSFEILSSGLYSDKILAIVRELSCNAYDAHVAAGKADVPFQIQLPTALNPTFYVKDFGTGLDREGVTKLYTTYFESTKTDSNDFIGALGLGSKSPFSYASNFLVEARHNGVKRMYSAFKNEQGLPSISALGEEATDEPNGLTITLSVRKDDCSKFEEAARKALMYFNPCPEFIGRSTLRPYDLKHTVVGDTWKIRQSSYYAHMNGPYLIQGTVAYPIDEAQFSEYPMTDAAKSLLGIDVDLYAKIGDVEVAASRESLSYDKRTITNIVKMLEVAAASMRKTFTDQYNACKSYFDAIKLHDTLCEEGSSDFQQVYKGLHQDLPFTWNNQKLSRHTAIDIKSMKSSHVVIYKLSPSGKSLIQVSRQDPITAAQVDVASEYGFEVNRATHVLIDPELRGSDAVRTFLIAQQRNGIARCIVLRPTSKTKWVQAEIDKLIQSMGSPSVINTNTITITKKATTRSASKRNNTERLQFTGRKASYSRYSGDKYSRLSWSTEQCDLAAGGYYLELSRFDPMHNGRRIPDLVKLINIGISLNILPVGTKVWGFNEREMKDIKDNAKWINLAMALQQAAPKFNDPNKLVQRTVHAYVVGEFSSAMRNLLDNPKIIDKLDLDSELRKHLEEVRELLASAYSADKHKMITDLLTTFDIDYQTGTSPNKLAEPYIKTHKALVKRYGMLSVMYYSNVESLNHLVTYINQIDQLNKMLAAEQTG